MPSLKIWEKTRARRTRCACACCFRFRRMARNFCSSCAPYRLRSHATCKRRNAPGATIKSRSWDGPACAKCILALVLGNQLTRPLFLLAQGTREVARGDYTPKREIRSKDELGFLTQSFNAMTRQLSDARAAVERNRNALEQAKAYLESVLANLSAGVFVFDRQFR